MARSRSNDPRSEVATFKVTLDERLRIQRRARAAGFPNPSEFIRARCLTDPPERQTRAAVEATAAPPAPPPPDPGVRELTEQVRRAGLTVNECNKLVNQGRMPYPGMGQELEAALADIRAYLRQARAR